MSYLVSSSYCYNRPIHFTFICAMAIYTPNHFGMDVEYGRTTSGGKVPLYATYGPSQVNSIPVDVCGIKFRASHDFMAMCHENRHFLDVDLWKELKEKTPSLDETIAPHPPCKMLHGTRVEGGNAVIGMLKNHLKVRLINVKRDTEGKKIQKGQEVHVMLKNVLLVQSLPVPLHISAKTNNSFIKTGAFELNQNDQLDMEEDNFPEKYRDHHFWTKRQDMPYVINMGVAEIKELAEGLDLCMEEGDGKDARNALAEKYGWRALRVNHSSTESWEHEDTGDLIDYYPLTDRAKTTLKINQRDEQGRARGNPENKDLDDVGGNGGLAKIFENIGYDG